MYRVKILKGKSKKKNMPYTYSVQVELQYAELHTNNTCLYFTASHLIAKKNGKGNYTAVKLLYTVQSHWPCHFA